MNYESILRKLPSEEKVFRNQKRVRVLKAANCFVALSKLKLEANQIKEEIQKLINSYKLVKVKVSEKNENNVDLFLSKTLSAGDLYMWAEDSKDYLSILITLLAICLVFFIAMIRLWPPWLRTYVGYSRFLVMGLIGFLVIAAIVRFIVFGITYFTHKPGIWLLPNLFAECGFFESFKPLYCWANEDVSYKKNED